MIIHYASLKDIVIRGWHGARFSPQVTLEMNLDGKKKTVGMAAKEFLDYNKFKEAVFEHASTVIQAEEEGSNIYDAGRLKSAHKHAISELYALGIIETLQ